MEEGEAVDDGFGGFALDRFEGVLWGVLVGWSVVSRCGNALSDVMNSASRRPMTICFSVSRWRAKLVKMEPVVGL